MAQLSAATSRTIQDIRPAPGEPLLAETIPSEGRLACYAIGLRLPSALVTPQVSRNSESAFACSGSIFPLKDIRRD